MEGRGPGAASALRRRDRGQQSHREGRRRGHRGLRRRGRETPDRSLRRPGARVTNDVEALAYELTAARADFLAALEAVDQTAPALVGDWSARELVAHLGYWAGHAVEVIHAVESGRDA